MSDLDEQLLCAARDGDFPAVRAALDAGADLHAEEDHALQLAAKQGHVQVVAYLIEAGATVPARNGDHVTFDLPVRNRSKHVWSFWSAVRTQLKAAHAAHFRSGVAKAPPSPLVSATRSVCSHRSLPAKSRYANRDQHCSDHVMDDIPW